MTKKDYILIASALHDSMPYMQDGRDITNGTEYSQWVCSVLSIGEALKAANPRFDYNTFSTHAKTGA